MDIINRLQDELITNIKSNLKKYLILNFTILILIFFPSAYYGLFIENNKTITSINVLDTTEDFFNIRYSSNSEDTLKQEMVISYDKWIRNLQLAYANSDENLRNDFQQLKIKYNIDKITTSLNNKIITFNFYYDSTNKEEFVEDIYEITSKFNERIHKIDTQNFINKLNKIYQSSINIVKANYKNDKKLTASILAVEEKEIDFMLDNHFEKVVNYLALGNRVNLDVDIFNDSNFRDNARYYFAYNNIINMSQNNLKIKSLKKELEYMIETSKMLIVPLNNISRNVDTNTYYLIMLPLTIFFIIFSSLIFILTIKSYLLVRNK